LGPKKYRVVVEEEDVVARMELVGRTVKADVVAAIRMLLSSSQIATTL
jgi:hypothetical protein